MLPGTKYTPESVLQILRRHVWLIVIPLVVGSVSAYLWAKRLPNLYRAETVMMLMPQRISDGYVKSAVNAPVGERLTTLKEQVLSRPHLEKIIQDLNLYPEDRKNSSMERAVARMQKGDTSVKPEGPGSFRLAYVNASPVVAQQVTERLAALFNDENLKYRENVAETTNAFLDSQMADAKVQLLEQEKKLEEYRKRYGSELPTQVAANLQAMQGAQSRLSAVADAMDHDRASRLVIERQLADLEAAARESSATAIDSASTAGSTHTAAQQLAAAQAELAQLEMRNKPDHPDVRIQQRRIRDLQAKVDAEEAATPVAGPVSPGAIPEAEVNRRRRIRDLTTQLADFDRQLATKEQQAQEIRTSISQYETRLNDLPTRESELVELTRDYSTLLNSYNGLAAKRQESTLSANLERKDVGEQFRVLDPPRIPEAPFSPDRLQIQLVGTASGLVLGLALVGFLEYRDSSFKTEEEIFRVLDLPVLAVIPLIVSPTESQGRKKPFVKLWATISGMSVAAVGVAASLWRQS